MFLHICFIYLDAYFLRIQTKNILEIFENTSVKIRLFGRNDWACLSKNRNQPNFIKLSNFYADVGERLNLNDDDKILNIYIDNALGFRIQITCVLTIDWVA